MGGLFGGGGSVNIPAPQQVDISQLSQQAGAADISQLQAGLAAERRFLPGQQELRTGSTQALTQQLLQQLPPELQQGLISDFFAEAPQLESAELSRPRLLAEVEQQRFADLTQGGQLSPEVASQIRREAGIRGARTGILPVTGGVSTQTQKDISARDIGLSASALRTQRQAAAEATGERQQTFASSINRANIALQQQQQQQRSGIFDLLGVSQTRETGRIGDIFARGQQGQIPQIGLSGADVANLTVSQQQQANQFAIDRAGIQQQAKSAQGANRAALAGSVIGLFSDQLLKTDIKRIGTHKLGIPIYQFRYLWDKPGTIRESVMAQDLLSVKPEAVLVHDSGYLMIDAGKI